MPEIPVLDADAVFAAVPPGRAIELTREAFEHHARGEWVMPAKVYVDSPPAGDFRAMPARGGGMAMLKWVTSFPRNPERGLPVVIGALLLSDAGTGELRAIIDCASVTSLRTGAAAAVSAHALARADATSVGIIGCGVNGAWAARCLAAAGYPAGVCFDVRAESAAALAEELRSRPAPAASTEGPTRPQPSSSPAAVRFGSPPAARAATPGRGWRSGTREDAATQDVVVTVTPGDEPVLLASDLRLGQHLAVLGADAHGKAEVERTALRECSLYCDEWEQASSGGELSQAVASGEISRTDVTELGAVLTGSAPGRRSADEITLFDSTGLAIQDLAVARAVYEAWSDGTIEAGTVRL